MSWVIYLRARLGASTEDSSVDLTHFREALAEHELKYKIIIGDNARTMVIYGGVDPNDDGQVTRMKANLDQTYMLFVHAHTIDDEDADAPLSDSEDETLNFGPPWFGMCAAAPNDALSLIFTPRSMHGGRGWENAYDGI